MLDFTRQRTEGQKHCWFSKLVFIMTVTPVSNFLNVNLSREIIVRSGPASGGSQFWVITVISLPLSSIISQRGLQRKMIDHNSVSISDRCNAKIMWTQISVQKYKQIVLFALSLAGEILKTIIVVDWLTSIPSQPTYYVKHPKYGDLSWLSIRPSLFICLISTKYQYSEKFKRMRLS